MMRSSSIGTSPFGRPSAISCQLSVPLWSPDRGGFFVGRGGRGRPHPRPPSPPCGERGSSARTGGYPWPWIPAFAGMTVLQRSPQAAIRRQGAQTRAAAIVGYDTDAGYGLPAGQCAWRGRHDDYDWRDGHRECCKRASDWYCAAGLRASTSARLGDELPGIVPRAGGLRLGRRSGTGGGCRGGARRAVRRRSGRGARPRRRASGHHLLDE